MSFTKEQIYKYGMRDIPDYEGLYAVTSCGKVWSYRKGIFLKPSKNNKGYLQVVLQNKGKKKCKYIHQLVLETYCPIENTNRLEINHKDEIVEHNYLNNLEWLSHKENMCHGTRIQRAATKISKKVRCIETGVVYKSVSIAAETMGVTVGALSSCLKGRTKTCSGLHWEYIN